MADMNLEQYIKDKEADFENKNVKIEKRKLSYKKKLIIFAIIFAAFVVVAFVTDLATKGNTYNQFKDIKATDTEAISKLALSSEAVTNKDLFDKFEEGYLGNKSMNSMNYGLMAENVYGYTEIKDDTVILNAGGKEYKLPDQNISQINITKDSVIYRGSDKKLYICKYDGSDKKVLIDNKVGTALLAGGQLYYVNIDDTNKLYSYDISSKDNKAIVNSEVKNFTILSDKVLYSDYNYNLSLQDLTSTTPKWTENNVAKFYFNGEIYVQNNDKVIKFNLRNHFPKEVASGIDELLGVDENNIYYSSAKKVYSQNIENGEKQESNFKYDYYKGIYSVNGKIQALGGEKK